MRIEPFILVSDGVLAVEDALAAINRAKAQLLMKENCLEVINRTYGRTGEACQSGNKLVDDVDPVMTSR